MTFYQPTVKKKLTETTTTKTKGAVPTNMSAENSFQRVLDAAEALGLHYKETERGKRAQLQTPGHSEKDRGTTVTYNGDRTLIYCHNGDTDDVLQALGLELKDLFDNPKGSEYHYRDSRTVFRSINKKYTQRGNTKGTSLFGETSRYENNTVYVVEGENDVLTAMNVCGVNAVSQAQGASTNPNKADWSALAGKDVVIVADDDQPGMKRANRVSMFLQQLSESPATIRVVKAKVGKDLSDHVAAGYPLDELIEVQQKVARRRVKLVPASAVKTEKVNWLVDQWIPENMLTLLAGREGIGKSTIACDWVAQFTKAGMKCAYLNSEDSRSFTVKPRLQAAGADLDLVTFIDVETEEGREGHLKLPQDTMILGEALAAEGVRFVVLDAAKSSMDSKLDGYRDDDVRQFLEPLVAMAEKYRITLLGLVHLGKRESKDTGKLILGSIAWSQIARSVVTVAVDDDGSLVVSNTKGNLSQGLLSREAAITSRAVKLDDGNLANVGCIEWGDVTDRSVVELLDPSTEDHEDKTDAEAWLEDYLVINGRTSRKKVLADAKKAGVASEPTIKRALKKIGGKSVTEGYPRTATWYLPVGSPKEITPRACGDDPTDPTERDLRKCDDPTEQKTQLDHAYVRDPTDDPTVSAQDENSFFQHPEPALTPPPVPALTVTDEDRNKVLDFLQEDYGLSPHIIAGSLQLTEEHVRAILQDLETRNLAYAKKGKYQKVVKAA